MLGGGGGGDQGGGRDRTDCEERERTEWKKRRERRGASFNDGRNVTGSKICSIHASKQAPTEPRERLPLRHDVGLLALLQQQHRPRKVGRLVPTSNECLHAGQSRNPRRYFSYLTYLVPTGKYIHLLIMKKRQCEVNFRHGHSKARKQSSASPAAWAAAG